jgi:uroporphyrinogen decarboxylase
MDHKERFYATINRESIDRPASWLGLPYPKAISNLTGHFGVNTLDDLRKVIGDDIYPVELPYHSPVSNAIYAAFPFAKTDKSDSNHRTLNSPGFFENQSDPNMIHEFPWPDPAKYIDPGECKAIVSTVPKDKAIMGIIWSAHFQDALAAFGMENALIQMLIAPEMFEAVTKRIVDFYLKANEIFFEAVKGQIDAVLIGNDYGGQNGLMVSPDFLRQYAFPGTKLIVNQAKSYGLKVIHHSCGSIYEIIPDLIDIGVDAIHPIQALAAKMEPQRLHDDFSSKISFVGGVDAQHLLVNGNPDQVRQKIIELRSIFKTGLIISPSHEAILPDINPANIEALFKALQEEQ